MRMKPDMKRGKYRMNKRVARKRWGEKEAELHRDKKATE